MVRESDSCCCCMSPFCPSLVVILFYRRPFAPEPAVLPSRTNCICVNLLYFTLPPLTLPFSPQAPTATAPSRLPPSRASARRARPGEAAYPPLAAWAPDQRSHSHRAPPRLHWARTLVRRGSAGRRTLRRLGCMWTGCCRALLKAGQWRYHLAGRPAHPLARRLCRMPRPRPTMSAALQRLQMLHQQQ